MRNHWVTSVPGPPAVSGLNGDSPDDSSLNVFWTAGPSYTLGYKVLFSVASDDSQNELNSALPGIKITDLEPSTDYKISVLPYSMNEDEVLLGPPSSIILRTMEHGLSCDGDAFCAAVGNKLGK